MNNTKVDFSKENQYEYKCLACGVTAFGPKGSMDCDDCKGLLQVFRNIFNDLRWNTHSSMGDGAVAIRAMHKAYCMGRASVETP